MIWGLEFEVWVLGLCVLGFRIGFGVDLYGLWCRVLSSGFGAPKKRHRLE